MLRAMRPNCCSTENSRQDLLNLALFTGVMSKIWTLELNIQMMNYYYLKTFRKASRMREIKIALKSFNHFIF